LRESVLGDKHVRVAFRRNWQRSDYIEVPALEWFRDFGDRGLHLCFRYDRVQANSTAVARFDVGFDVLAHVLPVETGAGKFEDAVLMEVPVVIVESLHD